jgi:Fur family transcriptional regulator, peroxide stress response regulator
MRLTKHRQEILDTLTHYHGALSAREVHEQLPHINLVTIYRNLDAFAEAGTIRKLHLDSNEALYEFQKHPHYHAVCTDCDTITHFEVDEKKLKAALSLPNFEMSEVEIVVRGTCNHKHRS